MSQDPRCAELETFLRTLDTRTELVRRWALGQLYPICQRDGRWHARTAELLKKLWPYNESELGAMLRESREVAAMLQDELSGAA